MKNDLLPNTPKRALVFGRVSTIDQESKNQTLQLKEYAKAQGWTVVETITEVVSGGKGVSDRDGLAKVFTLAHQRKFDVLLFWSLDRLSREGSRKTIGYLTELEQHGVHWHSYTESFLSTMGVFSDAIIALLAALARQERVRIGERTRAGLARALAEGKRLGRPRTAGPRIQQACQLRKQGLSYSEIGKRLGCGRVWAYQLVNSVTE